MEFHPRARSAHQKPSDSIEQGFAEAVQRSLMHLVKRGVQQPREVPFNPQAAARKGSHQISHSAIPPKGDE